MRQPSQGWFGLPSCGLHLPRLKLRGLILVGAGGLVGAGLLAWMAFPEAPTLPNRRALVARALYGQGDPDHVVAPGLHGLGGTLVPIGISDMGTCRFSIGTADLHETIDFRRITSIRYVTLADPAAGLVRSIEHAAGSKPLPQLPLVILAGDASSVCDDQRCLDRRVFSLRDPGQVDAARAAAIDLQRSVCAPTTEPP